MRKVHEQVGHDFHVPRAAARLLLLMLLPGLMVMAALAASAPFGPWQAPLWRDHPLVGTLYDTRTGRNIDRATLEQRLRRADIAVLGEVHDNPDHHRIQGLLLRAFAQGRNKPPAVVFEMIPTDMQQRLDSILQVEGVDADMVFDAVRWDSSGWPSRELYRPVMQAAVDIGAPIIAAGLPRDNVRKASREGLDALLSASEQAALQLQPLSKEMMNALVADIVKSHCDMIPEDVARRMSAAQRLRDALLADGVRRGISRQGSAVLITGNGHARKDRGAPLYLQRHGLPAPLVIWPTEARGKARTIADLLPGNARGKPAALADVIIVTPRAAREDPCKGFERFMQRKRRGQQN